MTIWAATAGYVAIGVVVAFVGGGGGSATLWNDASGTCRGMGVQCPSHTTTVKLKDRRNNYCVAAES